MKNTQEKNLSLRLSPTDYFKLRYIANWEGRSATRQAGYWVKQCIREFEKEFGEIPTPKT